MDMALIGPSSLGVRSNAGRRRSQSNRSDALRGIRAARTLDLPGLHTIAFEERKHLIFRRDQMYPVANVISHPNGMRFSAFDQEGALLAERIFFSIGGGFIVSEDERVAAQAPVEDQARPLPYPFHSAQELLEKAAAANITIPQLMLANECALLENGTEEEIRRGHSPHLASDARMHPAWNGSGGVPSPAV